MATAPSDARVVALGPVRHACHACGTCCTGWRIKVAPAEREKILSHAAALGVPDPIVDDTLRVASGACVFLGADRLCRIHAAFGAGEKPAVCQVFPRLAVRAEDAVRIGADPGCSSTWRSYRDGPEIDFPRITSPRIETLPPELAATEESLIRLCYLEGMTVPHLVGIVSGQQGHAPKLPPGFVKRILAPMKRLHPWLTHEDAGPLLVAELAAVAELLRTVDVARPPKLAFTKEMSALVLETLARTLFLRIGDTALPPMGKLVLQLGGAVACAYVHQQPEPFGRAIAAWSRISRMPGFWASFIPDIDAARVILLGPRG